MSSNQTGGSGGESGSGSGGGGFGGPGRSDQTRGERSRRERRARGFGVAALERIRIEQDRKNGVNNEARVNEIPFHGYVPPPSQPQLQLQLQRPTRYSFPPSIPPTLPASSRLGISHQRSPNQGFPHHFGTPYSPFPIPPQTNLKRPRPENDYLQNWDGTSRNKSQRINPPNLPDNLVFNNVHSSLLPGMYNYTRKPDEFLLNKYPLPGYHYSHFSNSNVNHGIHMQELIHNLATKETLPCLQLPSDNITQCLSKMPLATSSSTHAELLHQTPIATSSSTQAQPFFNFLQREEQKNDENTTVDLLNNVGEADPDDNNTELDLDLKL